jgi:hypothetical protein
MSDEHQEVGFVHRVYTVNYRPVTWRGWLATILLAIFFVGMIALALVVASAVLVIALVLFAVLAGLAILRLILSPADIARGFREFIRKKDA